MPSRVKWFTWSSKRSLLQRPDLLLRLVEVVDQIADEIGEAASSNVGESFANEGDGLVAFHVYGRNEVFGEDDFARIEVDAARVPRGSPERIAWECRAA